MADQVFSGSKIVTITFNDNCPLTRIYFQSFINCYSITSIRIPKNVTHIEDRAFYYCTSLSDVTFAEGSKLNYLETMCFRGTKVRSISFPQTLNYLGANSFSDCSSLSSVTFAAGTNLPTLAGGVFRSCTSLPTVTIPSSVTQFDPSTFVFCSNLLYIHVPDDNVNYCSNDGVVYTKNQEKLVCCPGGKVSALIFKYIIIIGSNAFYGCSKMQTLTFEKGCQLREIQDGTFYSCTALLRVDLPTSLQTVQQNAFAGCTLLSVITFTDYALADLDADSIFADCISLTTISFGRFCALQHLGSNIFRNCIKLNTINIPANCTSIGDGAFSGCTSLSDLSFESNSNLTSLSSTAFIGCTSLVTYNVPDSFQEINNNCFGGAPSISTVNIGSNLAITKIASNAFSSIPMKVINFGTGTTVSLIDDSAFLNSKISSFTMNSPMTISNNAFKGCASLASISVNGASSIGDNVFKGCTSLTSVSVNGATSIGNNAFEGCTSLQSFSLNTNVRLSSFVFKGCTKLKTVNLPNMMSTSIPSFHTSKRMKKGISYTSIPVGLFDGCSSLSSLTINNNIVNISDYAFRNCVNLPYIIPSTVTYIGDESFKNCLLIRDIPNDVVYFGNYSFYGTNIGKSILINNDAKYIGASSFIKTPLRVVYYCGERDFSNFSPSFNRDTNVVVTFSYVYSTFCGADAIHLPSHTCRDIMRTNNDGFDHLKKEIKEKMKSNSALLLLTMNSLGLF